ncbi:MAG TPA: class I SAM-dependent methyltransferase [Patescibacteria group bacterium]|nr:class I SAM-dependent methyltransferase [Patescibacteria group bacterium]
MAKASRQSVELLPKNSAGLVAKILEENPVHRKVLESSVGQLTGDEVKLLEGYISYCLEKGLTIEYLAESYLILVMDTFREQMYFQQHKKYRYSTFAEVANDVYFNETYMSHYMYALALTLFFWPNHLGMFRFLKQTLPRDKKGKYLEIGPGHGFFITTAMEMTAFDSFTGVDISDTSIEQTKALVDHYLKGKQKKIPQLKCMDFLTADLPDSEFDAVVMGEVLEHVEQPEAFMKRVRDVAKKDAYIFITTCIDAPVKDHIYLFENTKQIADLFDDCGLSIKSELFVPYEGKTLEESFTNRLPVNVAYVLQKKT